MNYVISKLFFEQVDDAARFVSYVSNEASKKLIEEVTLYIRKISESPRSYARFFENEIGGIEFRRAIINNGRYAIIYSINNEGIYFSMFLDLRKNNEELLNVLS